MTGGRLNVWNSISGIVNTGVFMAGNDDQIPNLGDAAGLFLSQLASDEKEKCQQEVRRFTRWFGGDRVFADIKAPQVANYAERLSLSDTDYAKKLELTKAFLVYARKAGWCNTNLSVHLRPKKSKTGAAASGRKAVRGKIELTRQGYAAMEAELASLKKRRVVVLEEMRRAAADKDFRENAPLAAAREERGHIEGRIKELEEMFKSAVEALNRAMNRLDLNILESAANALAAANKIEFYGVGGSAVVARDAHHKFFRLGVPCTVYDDPHMQIMSATILKPLSEVPLKVMRPCQFTFASIYCSSIMGVIYFSSISRLIAPVQV